MRLVQGTIKILTPHAARRQMTWHCKNFWHDPWPCLNLPRTSLSLVWSANATTRWLPATSTQLFCRYKFNVVFLRPEQWALAYSKGFKYVEIAHFLRWESHSYVYFLKKIFCPPELKVITAFTRGPPNSEFTARNPDVVQVHLPRLLTMLLGLKWTWLRFSA